MIVLPRGRFVMGSPENEEARSAQEGPQHEVTISRPFALGIYDVTRDEYAAFVRETGHSSGPSCIIFDNGAANEIGGADWKTPGFAQTGRHPVVCVDWDDAQAYVSWLNSKLHKNVAQAGAGPYRLPTEAEWEFAVRAGTKTRYYWGDDADAACRYANEADRAAKRAFPGLKTADCNDGFAATSPVGSFPPNGFGLYDIVGNAFQWIADCYHPSYMGVPVDGSAWTAGDCSEHVIRGGSLGHLPRLLRSAYRFKDLSDHRSVFLGFRLARDVE